MTSRGHSVLALALAALSAASLPASAEEPFFEQSDLFVSGTGGYHTYRIPALVVSKKGTVLAFCEGRKESHSDGGNIDLLLRRSFDRGKTWQDVQVAYEEGHDAPIAIGNPVPIADDDGTIHVVFCRNNERVFYTKSTDDGESFAEPVEISAVLRGLDYPWKRVGTGPGHGVQTHSGRLIWTAWLAKTPRDEQLGIVYSDDGGLSWQASRTVPQTIKLCDEATVLEMADGRLMVNFRNRHDQHTGKRAISFSSDGGQTWSEPQLDDELSCSFCQAALLRLTLPERGGKNRTLFSNPANSKKRFQMTVRLSYDEGKTWPVAKLLNAGPSSYSDLGFTQDGTILCLYEAGKKIHREGLILARFNLTWLSDGKDELER